MTKGYVVMPIPISEKVQVKRKYGKHPARFINLKKFINQETNLFGLLPKRTLHKQNDILPK